MRKEQTVTDPKQIENGAEAAAAAVKPRKKKKVKKIIRRIVILLLVLLLVAGGAFYAWTRIQSEYTVTYQEYSASIGTISNSLSFSGSLQAIHTQTATADSAASVRTLYVAEGDKVTDGTRLMRLSNGQIIEAEIDGTVNQLPFAVGEDVTAGSTVCQIVDFDHMKVSVRVDEYDIGEVHIGDPCRVTLTANEKMFESTVSSINHVSSSGGNVAYYSTTVYVDVDEGCYPGMQATVTIPQEEATNVVILKADAISFDETNKAFVFIRNENDEVERKYITTGVSNGNYVEITEGVSSGETVYAVVDVKADIAAGLLSGMFGRNNFMGGGNRGNGNNNRNGNSNWGNWNSNGNGSSNRGGSGNMPSMPGNGFGGGFGGGN